MLSRNLFGVIILAALPSCTGGSPPAPQENTAPQISEPVRSAPEVAADLRPRALLRFLPRGASSVGRKPELRVSVSCTRQGCADKSGFAELVARHTRIESESGRSIALVARVGEPSAALEDVDVRLTPVVDLPEDAWMRLRLTSDREIVFGSEDDTIEEAKATLETATLESTQAATTSVSFFTGSLPRVIRALASSAKNKRPSLQVFFSEPVALAQLASGFVVADQDGIPMSGCVWSPMENACASEKSPGSVLGVDYRLGSTTASLEKTVFGLSGKVRGVSRSVDQAGELMKAAAEPSGLYAWSTEPADWVSCSSSGDTLCARNTAF